MTKLVSGMLFVLLLAGVYAGASNVQSAKAIAILREQVVPATDTYWQPMFHHDVARANINKLNSPILGKPENYLTFCSTPALPNKPPSVCPKCGGVRGRCPAIFREL